MSDEPKDKSSSGKSSGAGPRGTHLLAPPVAVPSFRTTAPMDPPPEPKGRPQLVVVTKTDARPYATTDVTPKPPASSRTSNRQDQLAVPEGEDTDWDPRATARFDDEGLVLHPGDRLGSYEILGFIARGGFAEIYEASNAVLEETVAIKILQRKFVDRADLAHRMVVEARTLAQLRGHPYIVRIFDAGRDPRCGVFIIMERLRGKTLRDLINASGPMDIREAVSIAIYVALATHDLHRLDVVHRDLKPENIFLNKKHGQSFETRLLDLGIVRKKGDVSSSSRTLGTPLYMNPEQIAHGEVVPAGDQYSLAHILYEMLRGAHVWRADADKLLPGQEIATLYWHVTREIPTLPASICPPALWQILARALSREPAARFATMEAFSEALLQFLEVSCGRKLIVEDELAVVAQRVQALMKTPAAPPASDRPLSPPQPAPHAPEPSTSKANEQATIDPKSTLPRAAPGRLRASTPLDSELSVPSLIVGRSVAFAQAGLRYPLAQGALIGRKPGSVDILLDEDSISRLHVELTRATHQDARKTLGDELVYEVVDLDSSNGIEIDGVPAKAGLVRAFGELRVGDVLLTLVPPGSLNPRTAEFYPLGKRKQPTNEGPPRVPATQKKPSPKVASAPAKPKPLKRATMIGGVPEGWTGGDVMHLSPDFDISKPRKPPLDRRLVGTLLLTCILVLTAIFLGYVVYQQRTGQW